MWRLIVTAGRCLPPPGFWTVPWGRCQNGLSQAGSSRYQFDEKTAKTAFRFLGLQQTQHFSPVFAGFRPREELLVLDKYKYFKRHDRRTNLPLTCNQPRLRDLLGKNSAQSRSLIFLEFPDARCLLTALQEFLKRAQRLFLYQVWLSASPFMTSCPVRG